MISLTDELRVLKSDFSCLKEKITSVEQRIKSIENKITTSSDKHVALPELHSYVKSACRLENDARIDYNAINPAVSAPSVTQDLDNKTRSIIEELMWESTLSKAVLQVRENFTDGYSREMFLRYSFELVLEKDEQYRKMIGTLFGHLLAQNVVNQTNIFNSLCSVLMIIENSNNYNTQKWQNLTEILLPIILESHIKVLQLQRKAQAILKQECYHEFFSHLTSAIEASKKQNFKSDNCKISVANIPSQPIPTPPCMTDENVKLKPTEEMSRDSKMKLINAIETDYIDGMNLFDDDRFSKCKMSMEIDRVDKDNCKQILENMLNDFINDGSINIAIRKIEKLQISYDIKTIIEELIFIGIERESESRLAVGALLLKIASSGLTDYKKILVMICNNAHSVEKFILNPNTRNNVCVAFAEILSPLIASGKVDMNQLTTIASTVLPEETKAIFTWMIEKILSEKNVTSALHPVKPQPTTLLTDKVLKRLHQYLDKGERVEPKASSTAPAGVTNAVADVKEYNISKPKKVQGFIKIDPPMNEPIPERQEKSQNYAQESSEQDNYLMLKRKKLLKERIENIGDKSDIKIEDLIADQNAKKAPDTEAGDAQSKIAEPAKPDADLPPVKQPENLPSSAIKEKMQEIIERLMDTGKLDECVTTVKDTFNECQTDLVFKAAFEYTKDKDSEYRTQSGTLIAEAFRHDPRRVGAQIMNTISLELGDFIDTPELWKGMAEIICSPILSGLIRFTDLKLLPKYFKHTPYCASLLLAIFKEIIHRRGPEWLEENWKKSKLDLTAFLPHESVYKFITDNDLNFIVKDDQLAHLKENASEA